MVGTKVTYDSNMPAVFGRKNVDEQMNVERMVPDDFGCKVQSKVWIHEWFRDKEKEIARELGSSTCELREALTLSLWLGMRGVKEFLMVGPQVSITVAPVIQRVVKRRRRRARSVLAPLPGVPAGHELVLPVKGGRGKCLNCGGGFKVLLTRCHDLHGADGVGESMVYLCQYCRKDWLKSGRVVVRK